MILIFIFCVYLFKVIMSGGFSIWGCVLDILFFCVVDGLGWGNVVL